MARVWAPGVGGAASLKATAAMLAFASLIALVVAGIAQVDMEARAEAAVVAAPDAPSLGSPIRLCLLPNGDLLVSDYARRMIATVDSKSLAVVGWLLVEGKPLGLAYGKGRIYVGNLTKQRVEVYDRDGVWQYALGNEDQPIKLPTDIALAEKGTRVFVVDAHDKVVKVFSWQGNFLYSFPQSTTDPNVLFNPTGIAIDESRQEVLVSDYGDPSSTAVKPRIKIFGLDGTYIGEIPTVGEVSDGTDSGPVSGMGMGWGSTKTRFSRPQGLAVDGKGHVFLVDCLSAEVLVFERESKKQVKTMGEYGTEPGQMRLPFDLVIDPDSWDIFVTNSQHSCIKAFRQGGLLP